MNLHPDEGFIDDESHPALPWSNAPTSVLQNVNSVQDCEELAYQLLASLPRSRLATIQRRLAPLLQFDVVTSLPDEVALQIFYHLPYQALLIASLVSRRWHALSNDQGVWKNLCHARRWRWRTPPRIHPFEAHFRHHDAWNTSDDEGMGDSDEEADETEVASLVYDVEDAKRELTLMHAELDSGFASMSFSSPPSTHIALGDVSMRIESGSPRSKTLSRYSAPSILKSLGPCSFIKPDYKLLFQTHIRLRDRFLSSSYRLSTLQTRGVPPNSHTNTIYCLQLYTNPTTGVQTLFTGSRDKTVREWNLKTGTVERVISNIHTSSVLSICVYNGLLASAGSDRTVAVYDLENRQLVKVISDHEDSVLCVRFDSQRLVSCSKDRTVRTYAFPDLQPQFVLRAHRAAVNAVAISPTLIVSGSGDRSIRLWDAKRGKLLRTFENHHTRGIASIDFKPPYILSGSSDKHLRFLDISTLQGWSTSPDHDESNLPATNGPLPFTFPTSMSTPITPGPGTLLCPTCGTNVHESPAFRTHREGRSIHGDLVRSVALADAYVISGSYDHTLKVWDRTTGALVADLAGGHNGRIFCIAHDSSKIVSCGEDMTICIWDFSHGIDTSFIQL